MRCICGCGGFCDCDACTVVCVACVMLRECEGVRLTAMLAWGWVRFGCGECRACGWYPWFQVLCLLHLTCYG